MSNNPLIQRETIYNLWGDGFGTIRFHLDIDAIFEDIKQADDMSFAIVDQPQSDVDTELEKLWAKFPTKDCTLPMAKSCVGVYNLANLPTNLAKLPTEIDADLRIKVVDSWVSQLKNIPSQSPQWTAPQPTKRFNLTN